RSPPRIPACSPPGRSATPRPRVCSRPTSRPADYAPFPSGRSSSPVRRAGVLALAALLQAGAAGAALAQEPGALAGEVHNAVTRAALEPLLVLVQPASIAPITTTAGGRFVIVVLAPGRSRLNTSVGGCDRGT